GKGVTSLDSIEAGRWSRKFLVDGYSSRALARGGVLERRAGGVNLPLPEEPQAALKGLARERKALLERLLDEPTFREMNSVAASLAEVIAEIAKLPPEQVVYAATSSVM